jgi:hypothetical protein
VLAISHLHADARDERAVSEPEHSSRGKTLTRVYRERTEDREFINTFTIKPLPEGTHPSGDELEGYYVSVVSREGSTERKFKELWMDSGLATFRWHYRHDKRDTDLVAKRNDNAIHLTGRHREKAVDRRFTIDDLPWRQQFPLDLEQFVHSNQRSTKFWAIGTDGPAGLKIARFIAAKKEYDTVNLADDLFHVLRIRISFFGLLSLFWHGDAWHRLSDGEYIRFRSSEAPGHPPALLELIR